MRAEQTVIAQAMPDQGLSDPSGARMEAQRMLRAEIHHRMNRMVRMVMVRVMVIVTAAAMV